MAGRSRKMLLCVLAVAVLDEFLQGFVGRTSLVSDIVLDFSGALCGIAAMLAVVALLGHARRST